jgi:hypothetical protein
MLHRMNTEEKPAEFGVMHLDRWTDSYRDNFNDIWVVKRHGRKQWELAERQPGNHTFLHSRHRKLECALEAANALCAERHARGSAAIAKSRGEGR